VKTSLNRPISLDGDDQGRKINVMHRAVQLCLIATLSILVSACVGARPIKYYHIEIPATQEAAGATYGVALVVGNIDSPPIMRDGRILYQVGANEIGAYEYHRWVETPDRMIQDSLVRLLRSSGRYPSVDTQRSGATADYIVRGKLYEFCEIDKPEVHTRVSMEIELRDAKTGRTVWSRLYTREDPVDGKEIPDVVQSLDQNLRRGLLEIVAGVHQYFAAADAAGNPRVPPADAIK
jgi:ABC-type uncharacterized transport system auxiliary subunit